MTIAFGKITEVPFEAWGDLIGREVVRQVVEVAHSWFNRFRGILMRWAKSAESYLGVIHVVACLIVGRKLLTFSGEVLRHHPIDDRYNL